MKRKAYVTPTVTIEGRSGGYTSIEKTQNLQEQKESFLKNGTTPIFNHHEGVKQNPPGKSAEIRFDLLGEAEFILNKVKQHFGNGERFLNQMFGSYISQEQANDILMNYIRDNSLQESLNVYWSNNMICSARMVWSGYPMKLNRPEFRRYALWINGSNENPFLRTNGMLCLLDHEIGTHFLRTYNDGLQPWYSDRGRFGLRNVQALESVCSEEGLASINTALRSKEPYLWLNALKYYAVCKSTELNFTQLFDHLERFLQNPEQRWKMVMRIKKGLQNPNDLGGHGGDQCYFEGAVKILRNLDAIDFTVLMSGKVCYDEVSRVKRVVRRELVKLPVFMHNMKEYLRQLRKMMVLNGLDLSHPHYPAPSSYLLHQKVLQSQKSPGSRKVSIESKTKASLSVDSDISKQGSLLQVFISSVKEESSESSNAGNQKHSSSSSANKTESDKEIREPLNLDKQLSDYVIKSHTSELKTDQIASLSTHDLSSFHAQQQPQKEREALRGDNQAGSAHSIEPAYGHRSLASYSSSSKGLKSCSFQTVKSFHQVLPVSSHHKNFFTFPLAKKGIQKALTSSAEPSLFERQKSSSLFLPAQHSELVMKHYKFRKGSSSLDSPKHMSMNQKTENTTVRRGLKQACKPLSHMESCKFMQRNLSLAERKHLERLSFIVQASKKPRPDFHETKTQPCKLTEFKIKV